MNLNYYCCITFVLVLKFAKVIQDCNAFTPPLQPTQLVPARVPAAHDPPRTPFKSETPQERVLCGLIMPNYYLRAGSLCALAMVHKYMRAIAPEAAARPRQHAAYFLRCMGEAYAGARALPSGWCGVVCMSVRHAACS